MEKIFSKKNTYLLLFLIVLIRVHMFLLFPYTSTDGPWMLSAVFSYMNGFPDYSYFAYEFLGDSFSPNLTDILFSLWFKAAGISTHSFFFLGLASTILTVILWHLSVSKYPRGQSIVALLSIAYILSPYTYGFRMETYTILVISLMFFTLIRIKNFDLKILISIALAVISGLLHHVGGLFALLFLGYYFIDQKIGIKGYLKTFLIGIFMAFALSNGAIIEHLTYPTRLTSETGNHFAGVNPELIVKYLVLGAPLPFLFFLLWPYRGRWSLIALSIIAFLLFLIMGRSYYLPYLFTVVLAICFLSKEDVLPVIESKMHNRNLFLIFAALLYSSVFFLIIPYGLRLGSAKTNKKYREIIRTIDEAEKNWATDGKKYFLPSQLSMEVIDNPQSRLLYRFMGLNDGIQDVSEKAFYVFQKEQLNWIHRNFDTSQKEMIIQTIVPPEEGEIRISSIYKFKEIRADSVGLWHIRFE